MKDYRLKDHVHFVLPLKNVYAVIWQVAENAGLPESVIY